MARRVESTMGFEDISGSEDEIGPMMWHKGHRTQAVAMVNYPALLVSCEINDDHGMVNRDAQFVVLCFGIHQTESGRVPVAQVMARCQNMILLPKMVLLRMDISGDMSSFAEIVGFVNPLMELVPTRFMHLKRDFVWNAVQSVISWDEDRQRVAARLKQVIPFVNDEGTGSFSDEASQDTLAQLEAWFYSRFKVVGNPPRVMRELAGARVLQPSEPAPQKQARTKGPQHPPHVYFSTQEPRSRLGCDFFLFTTFSFVQSFVFLASFSRVCLSCIYVYYTTTENRIQELFLTLYETLPWVAPETDSSSKRGNTYKFAIGRRILNFLKFLASQNDVDSDDVSRFFEQPQGFKLETLKDLYKALLKYAEDHVDNGHWRLDFAGDVNPQEEMRKLISKCFVRVHQRLQFLTLYVRCLHSTWRPLGG